MNPPERIRPTASRRRRRMIIEDDDEGHNDQGDPSTVHEENVVHEHMVHEQVDVHEQEEAAPAHGESIWRRNMMELRDLVSSHGILKDLMICMSLHDTVIMFQLNYGLASLKMIDNNLISAFVERLYSETSSFHMPFGEMTITLDDVVNLLGLPIRGEFYSPPDVDRVTEVFRRQCAAERFDCAARAYLLNLVGSTIFADKSHTLVDAKYLLLFRYLDGIDKYAWGTAALVVFYDYLSDVCYCDTKQLGGYMTLLQCWIYEYFPNICNRGDQGADVECFARMNRWCYKQGKHKVHEYRSIIDALTPADVIWRPWENHRGVIPFDDITLYTGHIRLCSTVVKYLPERCLRQFGYIQYIPSPPLPDPARLFDVDVEWLRYVTPVTELFHKLRPATYPSECEDGYLEWFYQVSHPLLV
uniref:Protein MAINTENANCE OF MERISTEMS-like n=1 Tax=Cicer arietinum TaxID=3827 RepID=A0A1S2Y759_CICAR|nr:protein MAINTENANCE OF MERISTEMS-like [Cicer arietinum]